MLAEFNTFFLPLQCINIIASPYRQLLILYLKLCVSLHKTEFFSLPFYIILAWLKRQEEHKDVYLHGKYYSITGWIIQPWVFFCLVLSQVFYILFLFPFFCFSSSTLQMQNLAPVFPILSSCSYPSQPYSHCLAFTNPQSPFVKCPSLDLHVSSCLLSFAFTSSKLSHLCKPV